MKKALFIFSSIIILLSACEKWLDINVDPNNPSTIGLDQVLPGVYFDIGDDFGIGYSRLGYVAAVYVHQLTSREAIDQYGITGGHYSMTTYWSDLYSTVLPSLDLLIQNGEESDNLVYAGIGKILKAYVVGQMVDVWGEMPYSEANQLGTYNAKFDDDEAIYADLFVLLNNGIADLENESAENLLTPGSDDLIYGGDVTTWIKAANSIKLKLYNNVRLTGMYDQAAVNALVADDGANLIGPGEDLWIPFNASEAPDNRNPAFTGEYSGAQISNYISPWFYELLLGENTNIYQANPDPRVPYYIVTQLDADETPENPTEYRHGNFVSIYFGSTGPDRDHGGRNTFAMMGLYPCGGAFDDDNLDKSSPLGKSDGTGAAPYKMITYPDVLFTRAELAQVGASTDATPVRDLLEAGMYAAFEQVDEISGMAALATVPAISGSGADTVYIDGVLADFDAGSSDRKLEHIMTQKWIAAFGSAIESYNDYRRTGYPIMFDPLTMADVADGGPDGNGPVAVTTGRTYALSWPWSADELSLNSAAPSAQKSPATYKVFWDVD
jgi:hypothetical protein